MAETRQPRQPSPAADAAREDGLECGADAFDEQEQLELTCCVCMKRVDPCREALTPCNHQFCVDCVLDWAEHHSPPSCPLCKQPFSTLRLRLLLDGSVATKEWAEESVALLLRCHWRQSALPHSRSKLQATPPGNELMGMREPSDDDDSCEEEGAWEEDARWNGYYDDVLQAGHRSSRAAGRSKKHLGASAPATARPVFSAARPPSAPSKARAKQRTETACSSQPNASSRGSSRQVSSDQSDWVRPVFIRMD